MSNNINHRETPKKKLKVRNGKLIHNDPKFQRLIQQDPEGNTDTSGSFKKNELKIPDQSTTESKSSCIGNPIDPSLELIEKKNTKCSVQFVNWSMTIPGNLFDKKLMFQLLKEYGKKFWFQLEQGEQTDYKHFQIFISLKTKQRRNELQNLFGRGIHVEPMIAYSALIEYCTKADTRLEGPWTHEDTCIPDSIKLIEPKGWQLECIKIANEVADDRKIHVFYSKECGMGKTQIAKYLAVKIPKTIVLGAAKANDLAHAISKIGDPNLIVFIYPKYIEAEQFSWPTIEQAKDGMIFSGKYESKNCLFNSPHIFIFANTCLTQEQMDSNKYCDGQRFVVHNVKKYDVNQ